MRGGAHDHVNEGVAGVQGALVVFHFLAHGHGGGFRRDVHIQHFASKVHVIDQLIEQFLCL